jgi:hypothetical protein
MKRMKIFCLIVCIGLIFGCSTIHGVKYDYNKQTDFSRYRSYDWMPTPASADMNKLVIARVKKAIEAELGVKGLNKTSQNPDFLIAEHLGKKDKVRVENWGYGYYGPHPGYWGGFWGPGGVSTHQYEEGWLILDFVDAGSKKLIWRGTAKAEIQNIDSPEKSEKLINKAVKKILKKYPPSTE